MPLKGNSFVFYFLAMLIFGISSLGFCAKDTATPPPNFPPEIVEKVLNEPKVLVFLHPEIPGRVPVVISGVVLQSKFTPSVFGQPVRVVQSGMETESPIFEFIDFKIEKNRAMVETRYKVEGIHGTFKFKRGRNGEWKLVFSDVREN